MTTAAPPVDRPRTRRVSISLAAIALGGFGIGTTEFVSMGLLPQIATDLGASIPDGGHLISAYALGVVVGAPVVAVLAARVARTGLLIALMAAFALGNAASALAPPSRRWSGPGSSPAFRMAPTSASARSSRPVWCRRSDAAGPSRSPCPA